MRFPLVRGDTSNIEGGEKIIPDLANVALGMGRGRAQ
jgi:hypothetical protein